MEKNSEKISLSLYIFGNYIITTNYKPKIDKDKTIVIGRIKDTNIWIAGRPYNMFSIYSKEYLLKDIKIGNLPYSEYYYVTDGKWYNLYGKHLCIDGFKPALYEYCTDINCKELIRCLSIGYTYQECPLSFYGISDISPNFLKEEGVKIIKNSRKFFKVVTELIKQNVPLEIFKEKTLYKILEEEYNKDKSYKIDYLSQNINTFIDIIKFVWKHLNKFLKIQKTTKKGGDIK